MKLQKLIFSPEGHSEVELDLTGMCMSILTFPLSKYEYITPTTL